MIIAILQDRQHQESSLEQVNPFHPNILHLRTLVKHDDFPGHMCLKTQCLLISSSQCLKSATFVDVLLDTFQALENPQSYRCRLHHAVAISCMSF